MKNFLIIDANNIVHRAFHVSKTNSNFDFEIGFERMINNLIEKFNPEYIAIVFDHEEASFRQSIYKEYKKNREKNSEVETYVNLSKKIVEEKAKTFCFDYYEADDVIATLALKAENNGNLFTIIATSDKDMFQLVTDNTIVYNAQSKTFFNKEKIEETYGIKPENFIDYLALQGDDADNIPGLRKCGPNTAKKLIQHFYSVENMINKPEEILDVITSNKKVIYEQVINHSQKIILSKDLITLRKEIDIALTLKDIRAK